MEADADETTAPIWSVTLILTLPVCAIKDDTAVSIAPIRTPRRLRGLYKWFARQVTAERSGRFPPELREFRRRISVCDVDKSLAAPAKALSFTARQV